MVGNNELKVKLWRLDPWRRFMNMMIHRGFSGVSSIWEVNQVDSFDVDEDVLKMLRVNSIRCFQYIINEWATLN